MWSIVNVETEYKRFRVQFHCSDVPLFQNSSKNIPKACSSICPLTIRLTYRIISCQQHPLSAAGETPIRNKIKANFVPWTSDWTTVIIMWMVNVVKQYLKPLFFFCDTVITEEGCGVTTFICSHLPLHVLFTTKGSVRFRPIHNDKNVCAVFCLASFI